GLRLDGKATGEEIRCDGKAVHRLRRDAIGSAALGPQAVRPHEPADPLPPTPHSPRPQLRVDLRRAIALMTRGMDGPDLQAQPLVPARPRARATPLRGVEAGG